MNFGMKGASYNEEDFTNLTYNTDTDSVPMVDGVVPLTPPSTTVYAYETLRGEGEDEDGDKWS